MKLLPILVFAALSMPAAGLRADRCLGSGVEVQVLGSGGPELTPGRASASYLIRRDGRASVLIDAGGGSALRFGDAGARFADLDLVLFTHLHADHSADFAALVKSSYFQDRKRVLPVLGPAAGGDFPATTAWLSALFGKPGGAYAYLSDYLPGGDGSYVLQARDIAIGGDSVEAVYQADGLQVSATTLVHGPVPALGWRIDIGKVSVAFSGDTDGDNGQLERLAADVSLLVAHNAVPEGATGAARALHMPPSVIGRIAGAAAVKSLLLSHRMSRALGREAETASEIRKAYDGPLDFADDLDCIPLIPTLSAAP